MKHYKIEITLPLNDNYGRSLSDEHFIIKQEILTIAGGYTEQAKSGVWLDGNTVYRDNSTVVTVIARTDLVKRLLLERAESWRVLLSQAVLLVIVTECEAHFLGEK